MSENFDAYFLGTVLAYGYTTGGSFSPDDIRRSLERRGHRPAHSNVWGASYRALKSRGIIEAITAEPSERWSRHGGLNRRWVLTDRGVAMAEYLSEV